MWVDVDEMVITLGLVESEVGRLRGGDMESSARDEKLSGVKGWREAKREVKRSVEGEN
jgi:hypothetical protein